MLKALGFIICFFTVSVIHAELELPAKHQDDKREFRTIVLDNQLKVILVSDPNFNKSSASLQVDVGSYSDHKDAQGLAHFTEHMLFLGTKKYPSVEEYGNYLKTRGGYSNAFTAGNRTNYHFEIFHESFEGALDRFSQFFIAPLFNPEYTEREVNAVDSEHAKNKMNDAWRKYQLTKILFHKNHAANHFSTGNKETLKDVDPSVLKDFCSRYYSANLMTLCLMSKKSLDWMETVARKYFSEVNNSKTEAPVFKEEYFPEEKNFRLIKMKPIKDIRSLTFQFGLPSTIVDYKNKSLSMLGFCIGHEGKGSLLSYLKEKNLATGLSAGARMDSKHFSSFNISITLTPLGVKNWKECIKATFQYINLMKKEGFKKYIYEENKTMARLNEVYSDKGEGTETAINYANNLSLYPIKIAHRVNYYFEKPSPESYKKYLDELRPENVLCMLVAKSVETDKKEPIYGTEYFLLRDEAFYKDLINTGLNKQHHMPKANPFVPKNAKVLPAMPRKILDNDRIQLWYSQDTHFKRPKVTMLYKFRMSEELNNLEDQVCFDFYTACLREQLNEWYYPASLAGIGYGITPDSEGLMLSINGYSDAAEALLAKVVGAMQTFNLKNERFAAIKDRIQRGYSNFQYDQAYKVSRSISRKLMYGNHYLADEKLKVVKNINTAKLKAFIKKYFAKIKVEAVIHGNITKEKALSVTEKLLSAFKDSDTITEDGITKQSYLYHDKVMQWVYRKNLPTDNACFRRYVLVGVDNVETRMITRILNNFINEPFYTEMRTKQQLGYIVYGGAFVNPQNGYLAFIIQSGKYNPDVIKSKSDAFIKTLPSAFEKMSELEFNLIKASVEKTLLMKKKHISSVAHEMYSTIFEHDENFNKKNQEIVALKSLKKERVLEVFKSILDDKNKKTLDILMYAKNQQIPETKESKIVNFDSFKKENSYRKKN
jgi:insulysin